jgi:hypothetical protein
MNNTTNKLSLQHPDTIDDTPPPTPVFNPTLLNTKHLSIDIQTWNDFNETNNQIPTMDVSPIYANNPHLKKKGSKTNDIVQKQTIKRDQEPKHDNNDYTDDYTDDRSCLMKMLMYLFAPDSP